MKPRALAISALVALGMLAACGASPGEPVKAPAVSGRALLPDVRQAKDRPPVVLVARDGDPSSAVSVAVMTGDDPDVAVALAGVVEARLRARGQSPTVTPAWSGYRATLLASSTAGADAATTALRDALSAPVDDKDLAAAKRKLGALAARPLPDPALARFARCVGSPYSLHPRTDDLDLGRLEKWRANAHGLGRTAFAVTAPRNIAETVAASVARLAAWPAAAPAAPANGPSGMEADVYEMTDAFPPPNAGPVASLTIDVDTASDAVRTAEALGDPHGPLASRLAALDLPFRMREITASADPRGGCVAIVLDAAPSRDGGALAARVADAVALVQVEAQVHLTETEASLDGRTLARRAGDARESAERAAWWALADAWTTIRPEKGVLSGSVVLGLPLRRAASTEGSGAISKETLALAVRTAAQSWQKPVAEGRVRVEAGQGEMWLLIASPCGTESETDGDAGLTALFATAASETAKTSPETRTEAWITADGAGLLVHGPAITGESASAHARRLADVVARSFAADLLPLPAIGLARAELLRHDAQTDGPALGVLASALVPGHPSWVVPAGREDILARASDGAVAARAQALRSGPLRVAVLANVDNAQSDAALKAADRWIDRRGNDSRTCRGVSTASAPPPRAGTYAIEPKPGAAPEALLAFPLARGDEGERSAATVVAATLDGDGGLLDHALRGPALARAWSARVVGWPRAPALVIRLVAPNATLDAAVMQTRALVDRLWKGALTPTDHERGLSNAGQAAVASALDPRTRVVATWRNEPIASALQPFPRGRPSYDEAKAFIAKRLGEDALVVVAARPPLVKVPPPETAP